MKITMQDLTAFIIALEVANTATCEALSVATDVLVLALAEDEPNLKIAAEPKPDQSEESEILAESPRSMDGSDVRRLLNPIARPARFISTPNE